MELLEQKDGEVVVLALRGRLDGATSDSLLERFFTLIGEGERQFVVDGSDLAYVSSSGLRVLLLAAKQLAQVSGRLALCSLNEQIRKVFDLTGLTSVFDICGSRIDAIEKLRDGK